MGISDSIAAFILERIGESNGSAEISRGEVAKAFACVPSQINYVLATRFTPEHGYLVESRRGGGGYIRIRRVTLTPGNALMHVVNAVGERIDLPSARAILSNLCLAEQITEGEAELILAAISPRALAALSPAVREEARASILKQCLLTLA